MATTLSTKNRKASVLLAVTLSDNKTSIRESLGGSQSNTWRLAKPLVRSPRVQKHDLRVHLFDAEDAYAFLRMQSPPEHVDTNTVCNYVGEWDPCKARQERYEQCAPRHALMVSRCFQHQGGSHLAQTEKRMRAGNQLSLIQSSSFEKLAVNDQDAPLPNGRMGATSEVHPQPQRS